MSLVMWLTIRQTESPTERCKMKAMFRGFVAVLAGMLLAFLLAPMASADTIDCSAKIVDKTSARVLDTAKVERALRTVEAHGADVYVRAFQNTPGGNADAFWAQGLAQCSNWRTPDGEPKANVIMVTFGMDRSMGIFFNASSFPSLNKSFGTIMSRDMKPNFRSEDFTAGVTSALNSIGREIDPNKPAPTPTDYSGVWKAVLWTLIAITSATALVCGAVRGMRWRRRRQDAARDRQKAQVLAQKAKTRVVMLLVELKEPSQLRAGFALASDGLPAKLVDKHAKTLGDILETFGVANDAYVELGRDPEGDPDAQLSTSRYKWLEEEFVSIADDMGSVNSRYKQLLDDVSADKRKLTRDARAQQVDDLSHMITGYSSLLDECERVFLVALYRQELVGYEQRLNAQRAMLSDDATAFESYCGLVELELQLREFARTLDSLRSARTRIVNARQLIADEVSARRVTLEGLEYVESAKALSTLEKAEREADRVLNNLASDTEHDTQVAEIERLLGRVRSAGDGAVKRNQAIIDERKAEEKRKRQREDDDRRRRSSGGFGSSVAGSAVGGYLGSSYGSSHSGSHSHDSGSSFGGGGSSWGGGGDFGGGGGSW